MNGNNRSTKLQFLNPQDKYHKVAKQHQSGQPGTQNTWQSYNRSTADPNLSIL